MVNGTSETVSGKPAATGVYPSITLDNGELDVLSCALTHNCTYYQVSKYLAQNTVEMTVFPVTMQRTTYTEDRAAITLILTLTLTLSCIGDSGGPY